MASPIAIYYCPCCGATPFWSKGSKETRSYDRVQCLDCDLEMEGDYMPLSSVVKWNRRVVTKELDFILYDIQTGDKI